MRSRLTVAVLLLFVAASGVGQGSVRQTAPPKSSASGDVSGHAWRADGSPLPDARLRLRNVDSGKLVATTTGDAGGRFTFDAVPEGAHMVELVDANGRVLAVGPLFAVIASQRAVTYVRLPSRAPWFTGFFTNAAAAAIATAATLGITAVGSNGVPASPQ